MFKNYVDDYSKTNISIYIYLENIPQYSANEVELRLSLSFWRQLSSSPLPQRNLVSSAICLAWKKIFLRLRKRKIGRKNFYWRMYFCCTIDLLSVSILYFIRFVWLWVWLTLDALGKLVHYNVYKLQNFQILDISFAELYTFADVPTK